MRASKAVRVSQEQVQASVDESDIKGQVSDHFVLLFFHIILEASFQQPVLSIHQPELSTSQI